MAKDEKRTLTPRMRFPEFRKAPEWEVTSIGVMGEVVTGSTPATSQRDYYGGEYLFVSPADISDLRFVEATKTTLTKTGFSQCRPVKAGSVLFVCIGSTIGKVAQAARECATNQQINSVIVKPDFSGDFVYYLLHQESERIAVLAGKQAVPIINKTLFSSVKLHAPQTPEQQKIADCLAPLDAVAAAQGRKVEALKAHKKGLMQQLFPREGETLPRLRFPEFRDKGEWEETTLDKIGRVIRGSSPRPKNDSRYYGGPVPRLMVQDVTRDGKWVTPRIDSLTEEGAKLSRPCPAGTLTIVCSGNVGVVSFLAVDACIHDGFLALVEIDETVATKDFLYHSLSTLREQFEKGATHGGVFTNLTTSVIDEFKIKCPPLAEQRRIAACLSALDAHLAAEAAKLAALKMHKKGLMQQLFPIKD